VITVLIYKRIGVVRLREGEFHVRSSDDSFFEEKAGLCKRLRALSERYGQNVAHDLNEYQSVRFAYEQPAARSEYRVAMVGTYKPIAYK